MNCDGPAVLNLTVCRGSNAPALCMRYLNPDGSLQSLSGHDLILVVTLPGGDLTASLSNGGLKMDDDGLITWSPSLEESRRIPPGRMTVYALEHRDPSGVQQPDIIGRITGVDYPNGD